MNTFDDFGADLFQSASTITQNAPPAPPAKLETLADLIATVAPPSTVDMTISIPQSQLRKFMAYQKRVYDWAIAHDKIALFLEMRLGKTLISIRWAQHKIAQLKANGSSRGARILIVCPLSVIPTWLRELSLEGINTFHLNKNNMGAPLLFPKNKDAWFVTHYEAVRTLPLFNKPEDYPVSWDVVICDESTKIRKTDAKITQRCIENFWSVPYKAILSGFPAPQSLLDYYTQFKFLHGEFMGCGTWREFEYRYGDTKDRVVANKNNVILARVKELSYSLKRYECGIGSKKEYMNRYVNFSPEGRETYDKFQCNWYYKSQSESPSGNGEYFTNFILAAYRIMQQMASGTVRHADVDFYSEHKLNELENLLDEELHNEKVVIWCNHVSEIKMILERLNRKSQVALPIMGEVDFNTREKYRLQFQNPESPIKYLVCQLRCAGMGLDFSVADTAIYFSNSWEVEHRYQSEDRIVHPKKQVPLLYIDLLTQDTIDVDLRAALDEKPKRTGLYQEKIYTNFMERMLKKLGAKL